MSTKSPKRPRDPNQLAKSIVDLATGDAPVEKDSKNKAAVELGRRGGKIGGRVRADRMSAEERAEAARLAASARWRKRGD